MDGSMARPFFCVFECEVQVGAGLFHIPSEILIMNIESGQNRACHNALLTTTSGNQ